MKKALKFARYTHFSMTGMKMVDGRKTRGKIGQKSEKAKLDKEWNQVKSKLMNPVIHTMSLRYVSLATVPTVDSKTKTFIIPVPSSDAIFREGN